LSDNKVNKLIPKYKISFRNSPRVLEHRVSGCHGSSVLYAGVSYLWTLSTDLAAYQSSDAYNFEVARGFMGNFMYQWSSQPLLIPIVFGFVALGAKP